MRKPDFNDLVWFQAVADLRSFTKAAAQIGVAQSTLSQRIRDLEARMGLPLLTRTTRNVALTPAGARLLATVAPRLTAIADEIADLMSLRDTPSGAIRLTLSDHAFDSVVWPRLKPVLIAYPDITIEFSIDGGLRNIVEDGFDAGVRLGESIEKDMIAVRIGPDWRLVAVASPAYLAARGTPVHPQDLLHHACIGMRHITSGGLYAWEFERDGQPLRVRVDGQVVFNNSYAMIDAAVTGLGVAYLPDNIVADHLASGTLVQVLDDWSPLFEGYFLYYPSRRQSMAVFRILTDALRYRA